MRPPRVVLLALVIAAGCSRSQQSSGSTATSSGSATSGSGSSSGTAGAATCNLADFADAGWVATFDDFCVRFNADQCALYKDRGLVDPAADCGTLELSGWACDGGGIGYEFNPDLGTECIAWLDGTLAQRTCPMIPAPYPDGGMPCTNLQSGLIPLFGACSSSAQCQHLTDGGSPSCVANGTATCSGICGGASLGASCQSTPCWGGYCSTAGTCMAFVAEGSPCYQQGFGCDPAVDFCGSSDGGTGPGYCLPYLGDGQPCTFNPTPGCAPSSTCDRPLDGGTGRFCNRLLGLGEACDSSNPHCQIELVCLQGACVSSFGSEGAPCSPAHGVNCDYDACVLTNGTDGTCPAKARIGSPCSIVGPPYCVEGSCTTQDGGAAGACAADAPLGSTCSLEGGPRCQYPYACLSGACTRLPVAGEACILDPVILVTSNEVIDLLPCAVGDFCQGTQCIREGATGDACAPGVGPSCQDGFCNSGGRCGAVLPPGSPCEIEQFECSGLESCFGEATGVHCVDTRCVGVSDGGNVCAAPACE